MDVTIRRIAPGDGPLLADVRLRALADAPYAFGSTHAERARLSVAEWADEARRRSAGNREAVFFAMSVMIPSAWSVRSRMATPRPSTSPRCGWRRRLGDSGSPGL